MYVSHDKNGIIVAASDHHISINGNSTSRTLMSKAQVTEMVGRKIVSWAEKDVSELRIAIICNWNMPCGISTYTKFLVGALKSKVKEVRMFSEEGTPLSPDDEGVVRCWQRGKSMASAIAKLSEWHPDFVIVQHEYGIFPNACYFLQMLQALSEFPYVVTMHSVYEHLDKTVCSSAVKNTIVHSENAKQIMMSRGHGNPVFVIPHGCIRFDDVEELWNIFQTPYAIVQFGFGFFYKGVDRALDAISYLKHKDDKFKNIFYCYLCAESPFNNAIHDQYYYFLLEKAKELDIEDNIAIVRGYQDEKIINNYLRTAKLALFPYVNNPQNVVYGASGAIRIAMANRVPIVASESHLFDDLDGLVPRPSNHLELAKAIDEIFSNEQVKNDLIKRIDDHTKKVSWDYTSDMYLDCYKEIVNARDVVSKAPAPFSISLDD